MSLFSFQGRTSRSNYWHIQLLIALLSAAIIGLAVFLITSGYPQWVSALGFSPVIALIWISAATVVRRLHDRGRSGWWAIGYFVIPLLLVLAGVWLETTGMTVTYPAASWASLALFLAAAGLNGWAQVDIGFLRGQRSANRYGPGRP